MLGSGRYESSPKNLESSCGSTMHDAFEGMKESSLAGAKGVTEEDGTRA